MTLQLWTNDYDTFVAESAEEAVKLMCEMVGEPIESYTGEGEFELHEKQDNDELTIVIENEEGVEGPVTKTVREWIDQNGKGLLCSTEY